MSDQKEKLPDDPSWYKDAVIYEVYVKAYCDSNNDGIGDLKGLIGKLDYLQQLGITAIWLLPFYPSPQRDGGYDISNYMDINSIYGTLSDFKELLRQAHHRGIRVITELVLNHTSDQHEWFRRSRAAKTGSMWRNYYVWTNNPDKYKDARVIFQDFESSNWAWDPVAKEYYWHRFYSHQPDLNYDNPYVQRAMFRVLDFWFGMGVDGMRLDAVPYLYEREGTSCENLPETYEYLRKLRAHVDSRFKNRMLLAEANQWPEDAVAYFGSGDICQVAFHFPLMPRMYMSLWMEDRYPIVDIIEQTPQIPDNCQWALFLRNHDELTLEMVTDEERDYMYKVYARDPRMRVNLGIRRRLAPLVGNNRRKIEIMNILLFSLPGTPIIYYGDEIGMGDNYYLGDRDGVRTPMQWSPDKNAGFSNANPHSLFLPVVIDPEYHYEVTNVENQNQNLSSLLWWMRKVIAVRKRFKAFGRGELLFLKPENVRILAFLRRYQDEIILVAVSLSRFSQVADLDLSAYAGLFPEELFSQNTFPQITETPYRLTFGPYDDYIFLLRKERRVSLLAKQEPSLDLEAGESWKSIFHGPTRDWLEKEVLPYYFKSCRWFGGKGADIRGIKVVERVSLTQNAEGPEMLLTEVSYLDGIYERYLLLMSYAKNKEAKDISDNYKQSIMARLNTKDGTGIIFDGVYDIEVRNILLSLIRRRKKLNGIVGQLTGYTGKFFRNLLDDNSIDHNDSQILKEEQTNTAVQYGETFFLKLYRKIEPGINPDVELVRFLTEERNFPNVPRFAGGLEYRNGTAEPFSIGLLQGFIPNRGDLWRYTLQELRNYYESALSKRDVILSEKERTAPVINAAFEQIPKAFLELIGGVYLETASLIGKRTAEMHYALASEHENPELTPEPFSQLYQRAVFQSMRNSVRGVYRLLNANYKDLPEGIQSAAAPLLNAEPEILQHMQVISREKIAGERIRIHGDYHLGQILFTGRDLFIIDFEGEPRRPLSERRIKRSALRDIAGMIRSFHYAAYSPLLPGLATSINKDDLPNLEKAAELWYYFVSGAFLKSYLQYCNGANFLPEKEQTGTLINIFLLDKAVYELGYELSTRPGWVLIPVRGITSLLKILRS